MCDSNSLSNNPLVCDPFSLTHLQDTIPTASDILDVLLSQHKSSQINKMANPLQTVAVPNTSPDPMDALRQLSRVLIPEGNVSSSPTSSTRSVPSLQDDSGREYFSEPSVQGEEYFSEPSVQGEEYFSEPDVQGYPGLGKRKIPPTPEIVWKNAHEGDGYKKYSMEQLRKSIEWIVTDMTSEEVHEMESLRTKESLVYFGERLAERRALSGRTSPVQPRGFPQSSGSGLAGMTSPTRFAERRERERKGSPWKHLRARETGKGKRKAK